MVILNNKREFKMLDLSKSESTTLTTSTATQIDFRNQLWQKFKECKLSDAELERSLGLFIRGSLLSRFLAISDIYKKIVHIPGSIFDFGTWRGQNAIICENLRSIFEPFNKQRKILCFDTFTGYSNWSEQDLKSRNYDENTYATGKDYANYLRELLEIHEGNNNLGHMRGHHKVIEGDVTVTLPQYLKENQSTLVSLAFFDLGLYRPTKEAINAIRPHLVPGSVLVFLQLTRDELPGDAIAFRECFKGVTHEIETSKIYSSFNIVTIKG
jgi:hypothetical protein